MERAVSHDALSMHANCGEDYFLVCLGDSHASFPQRACRLAVAIAGLGLLGLTAHDAERRTKEIAIRKAFGATTVDLLLMLSRDYLKLVLTAVVLGGSISYLFIRKWLEGYAYRIDVSAAIFITAGFGMIIIALVPVLYQSARATLIDPAKSLKHE